MESKNIERGCVWGGLESIAFHAFHPLAGPGRGSCLRQELLGEGPTTAAWRPGHDFRTHTVYATAHDYLVVPTPQKPVSELDAFPLLTPGHPSAAEIQPALPRRGRDLIQKPKQARVKEKARRFSNGERPFPVFAKITLTHFSVRSAATSFNATQSHAPL